MIFEVQGFRGYWLQMEWGNLGTCTLCRNCKLNRKRRSKSQGRDRNRYATSPAKTLPCLYLVNILNRPPPKKKFIVDNLTISHMNKSLEKRWNFNSRARKTKQRKNFSTFFSVSSGFAPPSGKSWEKIFKKY